MAIIDEALHFSEDKNYDILVGWYHAAITLNYTKIHDQIYKFFGEVGRMKFIMPVFSALLEVNRAKAEEIFEQNKNFYHPICKDLLQKKLKT
jgi:leukotriene-A4 hydrolase